MTMRRRQLLACSATAAATGLGMPLAVRAQALSSRPITIVVSFPAGGPSDVAARAIATGLSAELRQSVVVENRPGAGAVLGTSSVLAAPADGHTLLMTSNLLTTGGWLYPKLPYDGLRDFRAVAGVLRTPHIAAVRPDFPANNLQDLIRLARASPGKLDYGSVGGGSLIHLMMELFKQSEGVYITHIPYRGSGGALAAVMAGDISLYLDVQISVQSLLKAGKVKALGVTSRSRVPQFPSVPTFIEQGIAGFEHYSWYGLVARSATPDALVLRLNEAINRVMAAPAFAEFLSTLGAQSMAGSSQAYQDLLAADTARWGRVIKAANIRLD